MLTLLIPRPGFAGDAVVIPPDPWAGLPPIVGVLAVAVGALAIRQLRKEAARLSELEVERDLHVQALAASRRARARAIERLTGGFAHDFNNLMTAVLGNIELAQDRVGDDTRLARSLDTAHRAAERAASLTQQLCALAVSPPQGADAPPTAIPTSRGGERVLVVDTQASVRALTVNRLEDLGYDVLPANASKTAVQMMDRDGDVALVLAEVATTTEADVEILRERLESLDADVPLLLASASDGQRSLGERVRAALDARILDRTREQSPS